MNWEKSYANADKTKTYCVYTGPSEDAVRKAAKLNGLPVDVVTEIPADIKAEPRGAVQQIANGNHRFLVKRHGAASVRGDSDQQYGVTLLTSYGTADKQARTGCTRRRISRRSRAPRRPAARRSNRSWRFRRPCIPTEV